MRPSLPLRPNLRVSGSIVCMPPLDMHCLNRCLNICCHQTLDCKILSRKYYLLFFLQSFDQICSVVFDQVLTATSVEQLSEYQPKISSYITQKQDGTGPVYMFSNPGCEAEGRRAKIYMVSLPGGPGYNPLEKRCEDNISGYALPM